jgi:hypothetical protein
MKISHEVPFALLEKSRSFNDYDYALVHLFEEHYEYYNFFVDSIKLGRTVILDNSVFELNSAFDPDRFAFWINKLQPTEYIIPDVLDDAQQTIDNIHKWNAKYSELPGKKIGVVQGATFDDALNCYKEISPLVDKIAISFNCKFYEELYNRFYDEQGKPRVLDCDLFGNNITILTQHETKERHRLFEWQHHRIKFLHEIQKLGVDKPIHLLGCSLPQEFEAYRDGFEFIESVDTSNPIVHAMNNIKYEEWGLLDKVSTKLIEYLDHTIVDEDILNYNISKFKQFCNG